ncbi:hypothetical protein TNCV_4625521 [Trichonephila clavipes]|nr:hypothetical protein TNCV_4625521 [Trichonephila clavipes]
MTTVQHTSRTFSDAMRSFHLNQSLCLHPRATDRSNTFQRNETFNTIMSFLLWNRPAAGILKKFRIFRK